MATFCLSSDTFPFRFDGMFLAAAVSQFVVGPESAPSLLISPYSLFFLVFPSYSFFRFLLLLFSLCCMDATTRVSSLHFPFWTDENC